MFKLEPNPTFDVTVTIPKPGEAGQKIRVRYRHMSGEQYQAALAELRDAPVAEFLERLMAGWSNEDDAERGWEGMPVPFSAQALAELTRKYPRAGAALVRGFTDELFGVPLGLARGN